MSTRLGNLVPGLLTVGALGVGATALSNLSIWPFELPSGAHPISAVTLAIVAGILLGNVIEARNEGLRARLMPGARFCICVVLPIGIALLGARLAFDQLVGAGLETVLLATATFSAAGLSLWLLFRVLSLPGRLATLLAIGTAICGGSAIAAAAPVIKARDEEISWSIATVATLGLIVMLVLPPLGAVLDLEAYDFGLWAGLTIHQTPQVVAAGIAYGDGAEEIATAAKLLRVLLLGPAVLALALVCAWRARGDDCGALGGLKLSTAIPWFVVAFFALSVARTLGWLDAELTTGTTLHEGAATASRISLLLAMAAMGLETRFDTFRSVGYRPAVAGLIAAALVVCATFFMLQLT